ncbi:MAG: tetraacyldisaccharide 4'-kinase [Proteobacteria bacterium]|nr:tetraacyldisaccharide 4'-kinase [Pseudomonadota bacterium]
MTLFKAPKFWNSDSLLSKLLAPFSYLYLFLVYINKKNIEPVKLSVPVICVGNLVMGGAGKTPTVIALVEMLKKMGENPHIISRGYGAIVKGLKKVDPKWHHYLQVGDEPLMLSKVAPTWVCPNRVKAAKAAIADGATIIVMDDGFQNNSLIKDFNVLVVDAYQRFGNKKVFPSGPLREPLNDGLIRADIVVLVGDEKPKDLVYIKNVLQARFKAKTLPEKPHERVIAFAGLGYPEKFKVSLLNAGYKVVDFVTYPDHFPYTITEMEKLLKKAQSKKAKLITTSKDAIRVPAHYKEKIDVFKINLEFDDIDFLEKNLKTALNILA